MGLTQASRVKLRPGLVAIVLVSACADEPVRRDAPRRTPDKAALYGDPGLLPTREGEQARAEAAKAGELEAAIGTLYAIDRVRATVEADQTVIVLRLSDPDARDDALEAARRIAETILGPDATIAIEASAPSPEATPAEDRDLPTLPLAFALLGLGFSLGVTFDRGRRILRQLRKDARRNKRRR